MPRKPTLKRLILNFPGFEPTDAVRQIDRLTHGGEKTASLWDFELERKSVIEEPDQHQAIATFNSTAAEWSTSSRFVQFSWQDIISTYENAPYPQSLFTNLPKYLSFFLDGSVFRYSRASRRYWGFTIYPLLLMICFAAAAWAGAYFSLSYMGLHWGFAVPPAIILFLALCRFPGDLFYVNLSINDWGFARDMCNGSNPKIEQRYEIFANQIANEIQQSNYDEILVVGHSFGAVWAVAGLAKALDKNPKLLKGTNITFLALGSSLLKIAIVPAAGFLKNQIEKVATEKSLLWHEIQTKTDFISFYKTDPFDVLGLKNTKCSYAAHRVNFKNALSKLRHRKMMKSMYLAHRQYILYADKRVHFDFQLRCFGPYFANDLARDINLIETHPDILTA